MPRRQRSTGGSKSTAVSPGVDEIAEQICAAAKNHVERGWAVFRLPPGAKKPMEKEWQYSGISEVDSADFTWKRYKRSNIGILCESSNLAVLDVDKATEGGHSTDGQPALEQLQAEHEPLPETYTVRTPSGGTHYYFDTTGHEVRGRDGFRLGVDVKARGGMVVAAGSVRDDGEYSVVKDVPVAPIPEWLVEELRRKPERPSRPRNAERVAVQGERDNTLTSMAGSMRHAGFGKDAIYAALEITNEKFDPPKDPEDIERIANSISSYPTGHDEEFEKHLRRERLKQWAQETVRRERAAEGRPAAPGLVDLTSLLEEPDEEVRYRIGHLWPVRGNIVLTAQKKAGKTTLRDNLVRALVDDDEFLDRRRFPVTPPDGRVVVLDVELSRDMGRRWLRDQGIRKTDAVSVASLRGCVSSLDIRDPALREEWVEQLRSADCGVLILDPLGPVLAALGIDENSNQEVGRFITAWDQLLAEAGISESLVIHHMGHNGERARGATRLEDWADGLWRYNLNVVEGTNQPDRQGDRYLSAVGRDVDLPEVNVSYDAESRRLSVPTVTTNRAQLHRQAETQREEKRRVRADDVVTFVRDNQGCGARDIEKGMGGNRNAIRKAIEAARDGGRIRVEVDGQTHRHYPVESDS